MTNRLYTKVEVSVGYVVEPFINIIFMPTPTINLCITLQLILSHNYHQHLVMLHRSFVMLHIFFVMSVISSICLFNGGLI